MKLSIKRRSYLVLGLLTAVVQSFGVPTVLVNKQAGRTSASRREGSFIAASGGPLAAYYDQQSPSDYDAVLEEKQVEVDLNQEDVLIRDALKRELLLLSSVTNRGEYASQDEQNMLIDLVAQLEALNPTENPAYNMQGDWDLCLSSTQFFRSSPFFQSIRASFDGSGNKDMIENAFDIHDRATTSGRVGRVRQTLTDNTLVSEVDLEVGIMPGLPLRVKGTVVTTADLTVVAPDSFDTLIKKTTVTGSNIPLFNQWLDDLRLELPVSDVYSTIAGGVPRIPNKIFYLDEGMRVTRDQDDNFFVFTRA